MARKNPKPVPAGPSSISTAVKTITSNYLPFPAKSVPALEHELPLDELSAIRDWNEDLIKNPHLRNAIQRPCTQVLNASLTAVQSHVIARLRHGQSAIVKVDERLVDCGRVWSYLIPILDHILESPDRDASRFSPQTARPQAVIIVSKHPYANQVNEILETLATQDEALKVNFSLIFGDKHKFDPQERPEILVTTWKRLASLLREGAAFSWQSLRFFVFDTHKCLKPHLESDLYLIVNHLTGRVIQQNRYFQTVVLAPPGLQAFWDNVYRKLFRTQYIGEMRVRPGKDKRSRCDSATVATSKDEADEFLDRLGEEVGSDEVPQKRRRR